MWCGHTILTGESMPFPHLPCLIAACHCYPGNPGCPSRPRPSLNLTIKTSDPSLFTLPHRTARLSALHPGSPSDPNLTSLILQQQLQMHTQANLVPDPPGPHTPACSPGLHARASPLLSSYGNAFLYSAVHSHRLHSMAGVQGGAGGGRVAAAAGLLGVRLGPGRGSISQPGLYGTGAASEVAATGGSFTRLSGRELSASYTMDGGAGVRATLMSGFGQQPQQVGAGWGHALFLTYDYIIYYYSLKRTSNCFKRAGLAGGVRRVRAVCARAVCCATRLKTAR